MIAQRFRALGWVAGIASAATCLYLTSLQVAAERATLEAVEVEIVRARRDIRQLQTELGTRASMRQLEKWNGEVLALSAPRADQYLHAESELASVGVRELRLPNGPAPLAPVMLAAAQATPPPIEVPAAAPPAGTMTVAAVPAVPATMPKLQRVAFSPAAKPTAVKAATKPVAKPKPKPDVAAKPKAKPVPPVAKPERQPRPTSNRLIRVLQRDDAPAKQPPKSASRPAGQAAARVATVDRAKPAGAATTRPVLTRGTLGAINRAAVVEGRRR